ncbi:MAG: hypothetical protein IPO05_16035 [Flavobacteriales bacterium]|jgi:hypothetical protein|nr:hypothetical protein [Flavobacteriales bacterium]
MPLNLQIPDQDLTGFSGNAKDRLSEVTLKYASDVIEEANRIEAGRKATQGTPEVTRSMVDDAQEVLRRGLRPHHSNTWMKVLRVVAAVLALVVGIMYDKTRLQDGVYMSLFILLIAATIITVTISTLKE